MNREQRLRMAAKAPALVRLAAACRASRFLWAAL